MPDRNETVVTDPVADRVVVWIAFPLVGALAGWLLKVAAGWVADLRWFRFRASSS